MSKGQIVIVGAGQAGGRAAEALRAGGYSGALHLIGEEAEPPYERPALSKGVLLGRGSRARTFVRRARSTTSRQVQLQPRRASRRSRRGRSASSCRAASGWPTTSCSCAREAACGRCPARRTIAGVHYLRTIDDCRRLAPELKPGGRLVVVGGGFIGLEVVSTATKRGMSVAVIERQSSLLERVVPRDIAAAVERLHRARGVTFHLGATAAEILGDRRVTGVRLVDGTIVPADAVVVGIGVIPNTELAEAAGAESHDGLIVDDRGRTTLANIYAAGDVTSHPNPILGAGCGGVSGRMRRIRQSRWRAT